MKNLHIKFCLLSCLLLASCAQNRFYTVQPETDLYSVEISDSIFPAQDELSKTVIEESPETVSSNTVEPRGNNESDKTIQVNHITTNNHARFKIALADQNPPNEIEVGLTLMELESIALSNHPEIQQSLADVSAMKGQQFQVTRKPNPVIGYQAQEVGNEGKAGQQGIYFNQNFVTADKLELNGQVAGHLVQKKNWDWQVKELEIRNNVQKNFYGYQGALLKMKLAKELLNISEESTKTVQLLIDAGESKRSQLLQAEIEANRSAIAVNAQNQNVTGSFRKLVASVGSPGLESNSIVGSLRKSFPKYDWDILHQNMLNSHPEIQSARSQVQSANWAVQRAEVQKTPDIQTQLGVLYDNATLDTVVGLQIGGALPVHNKNRGNVRSRIAEYLKAVQEVERVKLSLKTQLADSFQIYETNRIMSVRFQESILPKAEESLKLISKGFEQGQDPYIQLLIVQKTYFQSNQEYVDILINVNQSISDLYKLKSIN